MRNAPNIPPLAGDIKCTDCQDSPTYTWKSVRIRKSEITERLRGRYPRFKELGPIDRVEVGARTQGGRPLLLVLRDAQGKSLSLEIENFRLTVDPSGRELMSGYFNPVDEGDVIAFVDGRGFGHGVGMCQYGAEGKARRGMKAGGILTAYYPTSGLTRAY
jgi:stage II sporulation protein D